MLDEYLETQKIVYKTLTNAVKKNKYSHAYLFEANNNPKALNIVLAFAKMLLCKYNYSNNKKCDGCNQCNKISKNIFSDLKIIDPDGIWIKKDQMDNLQIEFSKKSVEANKKIYIINNAESLNVQASNSILKFIEEPEDGIIAILITNNIYQMLPTIISRCQIISLAKNKEENVIQEQDIEKLNIIDNFVKYLEQNKFDTLLFTQKLWHNTFSDRKDYIKGFELLLLYYKDVLNYKLNRNLELYKNNLENIKIISDSNSYNQLIYKINKIIELNEYIKVNANQNLLLDKLVIELSRGDIHE